MNGEGDSRAAADFQDEVRDEVRKELASGEREPVDGEIRVALEEVRLAYGDNQVLDGISFEVTGGETLCILGGSGVGKSTILRLILRLTAPDSGRIVVDGRDLVQAGEHEILEIRQRMGMVFQGSALFDSLSVLENVAFPLREHEELPEEEVRDRVEQVLSFVDLEPEEVMELLPAELSGGMRKRVGIARAIIHQPQILLFDEPTSGLDPVTTKTIDALILKLQREMGVCAVVVTHDIRSASRIASRAALLLDGRIVFMGTPEEMFAADDEYVRAFLS